MPFAETWIHLEITILDEIKLDRERQMSYDIAYMWNLKKKNDTDKLIHKNRNRPTDIENKLTLAKGKGWGSEKSGVLD